MISMTPGKHRRSTDSAYKAPTASCEYRRINAFLTKMQTSAVLGRVFLFFLAGNTAVVAHVPETGIGFLLKDTPFVGTAIACVALLGLCDTVINDMLPDRFNFSFGLSIRHVSLMSCAAFFALCAYLAVLSTLSWMVVPYFVACALTISVHTFFDLRRRLKWDS